MKVKTKISALTLALALCGGALVGCGNKPSPEPTTYHVRCSQDATKYTVVGLESTYAVGANVSFSVTEVNPEDYKVTGVTSDDVVITTVSALNYKFTMPEKDVTLTVTTKAVEKYSVTLDTEDVVVGKQVGFTLKLGATTKMVTVSAHEGETKAATYSDDKVTFNEAGTFHLDLYDEDSRKMAVTNYAVEVRAQIPGEDPEHPTTSAAAFAWASTNLTPCSGESDANWGKKGYLSPKLYVTGKVISLDNNPAADKNASVTLEGGISTFHMGSKTEAGTPLVDVTKIDVGSVVTIAGYLYCYRTATGVQFGKDAAKTGKSQFIALDNTQLDSIVIPTELKGVINGSTTLTAQVRPYNGQTVEWVSSNPTVANVVADSEDSRKATVTFGAATGTATITAHIGDVISNECAVSVSETKQVYRELEPSEVDPEKSYAIAAMDGSALKYAKAEIGSNHYMTAVANESEAAAAKLISKGDGKYVIKMDSKFIGYQYASSKYHNILLKDSEAEAKELTYDATKRAFSLTGDDTSHTQLFLAFYSGSFQFSAYKYVDTNTHGMFWGWADAVPATSVSIPATLEVNAGSSKAIVATPVPANADISDGVWASSNEAIAKYEDGKVVGVAPGECNITFTLGTLPVQTCHVTVKDVSGGLPLKEAGADFTGCKGSDTKMPDGTPWTYAGGTLSFNNGGLKLSYTSATLTSDKLVSSNQIIVTLKVGALNPNQKSDGEQHPIFEVTGLNESKSVIDTETVATVSAAGDVVVTLEATAMRYVVIKFVHYPHNGTACCNVRLDKITLA